MHSTRALNCLHAIKICSFESVYWSYLFFCKNIFPQSLFPTVGRNHPPVWSCDTRAALRYTTTTMKMTPKAIVEIMAEVTKSHDTEMRG